MSVLDLLFLKYKVGGGGIKLTSPQKKLPSKSPALLLLTPKGFHFITKINTILYKMSNLGFQNFDPIFLRM